MHNYEQYDIDDFITDDFFIDWVLNPQPTHDLFWKNFQSNFPHQQPKINASRRIISSLSIQPLQEKLSAEETDQLITNVQQQIQTNNHKRAHSWFGIKTWAAAAAVLVTVTCFWLYSYQGRHENLVGQEAIAVNGLNEFNNTSDKSKVVRFADGSLAVLKPKSKLRYPSLFSGKNRAVYLEGEAFFEVQKDIEKPFFVYSQDMITQVVGTSFTVKAFGNADEFKVIVNTGKVKVYQQPKQKTDEVRLITLAPHQQAIYKRAAYLFKKDTVETKLPLAPAEALESFTLNRVTLNEVIKKLEEAYHVDIMYDKLKLGQLTLSAQLANLPLDQKIDLICKAINAEFKFSNGEIYIYVPSKLTN